MCGWNARAIILLPQSQKCEGFIGEIIYNTSLCTSDSETADSVVVYPAYLDFKSMQTKNFPKLKKKLKEGRQRSDSLCGQVHTNDELIFRGRTRAELH